MQKWQGTHEALSKSFSEARPLIKPLRPLLLFMESLKEASQVLLAPHCVVAVYDELSSSAKEVESLLAEIKVAEQA